MDLSYTMEDNYLKHFVDMVKKAKPVNGADAVLKACNIDGDVRVHYKDQADFECTAHQFGIFEEWKVLQFIFFCLTITRWFLIDLIWI
ncbi:hypothetical protein ACSBR1_029593 [Camellia fascicularis]